MMPLSRYQTPAILLGLSLALSSCTQATDGASMNPPATAQDSATTQGDHVLAAAGTAADETADATRAVADRTEDTSRNVAEQAVDKTKEVAAAVATTTSDAAVATGEAVTDAWITTHLNAKFVDESLLEGSTINVDTNDHVVTLKGTVRSAAGKTRAEAIARDTSGVTRVVNNLSVK